MLFPNVHVVNESYASDLFEQIMRINKNDILIAMSFPRYSRKTLSAIKFARDRDVAGYIHNRHRDVSCRQAFPQ